MAVVSAAHWFVLVYQYPLKPFHHHNKHGTFQIWNHRTRGVKSNTWNLKLFVRIAVKYFFCMEDLGSNSKPIPERWILVVKKKKDGTSLSYYICPESGQKFYCYEDLMRYVNYAKAAKLSIYSPDFSSNNNRSRKGKKSEGAADVDQMDQSSDSEDSTFKLPPIASLDLMEMSSSSTDKQSPTGKTRSKNRAPNEASSSRKGKGKKQKI